jgi:hypothetical protein
MNSPDMFDWFFVAAAIAAAVAAIAAAAAAFLQWQASIHEERVEAFELRYDAREQLLNAVNSFRSKKQSSDFTLLQDAYKRSFDIFPQSFESDLDKLWEHCVALNAAHAQEALGVENEAERLVAKRTLDAHWTGLYARMRMRTRLLK